MFTNDFKVFRFCRIWGCLRANSPKEYKLQTIKDLAILRRSLSDFVQIDHDMKNTLAGAWTVMKLCCSNTFDGWLVYWVIDLWEIFHQSQDVVPKEQMQLHGQNCR